MDEATRLAVGDIEQQRVALFRQAIWDHMVEGRRNAWRINKALHDVLPQEQ